MRGPLTEPELNRKPLWLSTRPGGPPLGGFEREREHLAAPNVYGVAHLKGAQCILASILIGLTSGFPIPDVTH
jgi:hypothetical protein